jgi:hypothetical protein
MGLFERHGQPTLAGASEVVLLRDRELFPYFQGDQRKDLGMERQIDPRFDEFPSRARARLASTAKAAKHAR